MLIIRTNLGTDNHPLMAYEVEANGIAWKYGSFNRALIMKSPEATGWEILVTDNRGKFEVETHGHDTLKSAKAEVEHFINRYNTN